VKEHTFRDLGAFELRELKERSVKNPKMGEEVKVSSRMKMVFISRLRLQ